MKYLLIIVVAFSMLASCQSSDKKAEPALTQEEKEKALSDTTNFTTIQWLDSTTQNMGVIKEGQIIEITYRFKNSGNKPLVISDVLASCGCTTAYKPEQAIAPGGEEIIKAKFDSHDKLGEQHKTLTVMANTNPDRQYLDFQVQVNKN